MRIEDVTVGMKVVRVSEPKWYTGLLLLGKTYEVEEVVGTKIRLKGFLFYTLPQYYNPAKKNLSGFGRFTKEQREKDANSPV